MKDPFAWQGQMRVAVDAVVFTILNNELKVLLIKRKYNPFQNKFAIPGGFVKEKEELETAVKRELLEETGVKNVFLKQLGAYGAVNRDPRGRILSITFIGLISPDQKLKPTTDAYDAGWHSISDITELAFDHNKILQDSLNQLKYEIQTTNIAFQILPKKFTLSQLQNLYEAILEKELDKRNFRKRIKELGILKETQETFMEGAHRPALLYEFKDQKYTNIREKIHVFL